MGWSCNEIVLHLDAVKAKPVISLFNNVCYVYIWKYLRLTVEIKSLYQTLKNLQNIDYFTLFYFANPTIIFSCGLHVNIF